MDQALLQSAARHRPRHAVVAHNRGRTARRNALARRPLVRAAAPVVPSICARSNVASPSLRLDIGARPAVLMVPGNVADAEAARAVRSAAGGRRDSSHVEVKYSTGGEVDAAHCLSRRPSLWSRWSAAWPGLPAHREQHQRGKGLCRARPNVREWAGQVRFPEIDDHPSRNPFLNAFAGNCRHPSNDCYVTVRQQRLTSNLAFTLHFSEMRRRRRSVVHVALRFWHAAVKFEE